LRSDGGLDEGVEIGWSGPQIFSPTISAADAAGFAALVGKRKIWIWDNYPANDVYGGAYGFDPRDRRTFPVRSTRIFLGPYKGRAPDLASAVFGVLANPMTAEPVASRIVIGAMARYLADPVDYDAERAWYASIADVASWDRAVGKAIAALAENTRSGITDRTESPVYTARRDAFLAAFDDSPYWTVARDAFVAELERERLAPSLIRTSVPAFADETTGFLERLEANANVAIAAARLLAAQRPYLQVWLSPASPGYVRVYGRALAPSPANVATYLADLDAAFEITLRDVHTVHGDRASTDLNTVYVNENVVDAFVVDAQARTTAWLPNAPVAASSIRVTVDGIEAPTDGWGMFWIVIPQPTTPVEVVATDGAGGSSGLRVSREHGRAAS
jgi:hyaluronoglucosaminidase